jgi:aminopeptidase N
MQLDDLAIRNLCLEQYQQADNMTDEISAVAMLANLDCPEREQVLTAFYARWQHEPLVVDKWFALQATSQLPDTLVRVKLLLHHPAFTIKNPNKVRALIGAFCQANPVRFHEVSGAGYVFLADQVLEIDALNPQIAARLLGVLSHWRRYDDHRQDLMKYQLERILKAPRLSPDVYEIATKSLGDKD